LATQGLTKKWHFCWSSSVPPRQHQGFVSFANTFTSFF
jgi:hypothetical protein